MIFKRELKINLKSFIIWFSIITLLMLLIIGIFPTMLANADSMSEFLEAFPKGILDVFGFDELVFSNVYNWYGTEGYTYMSLIFSCYAAIMGATILSKEESDKTIEFLLSKPITRSQIVSQKLGAMLFYLTLMFVGISSITLIGFTMVDYFDPKLWFLLNIAVLIQAITFASIAFLISCFVIKSKKAISGALGLVLGSYLLFVMSVLSDKIEFIKYISPFEYTSSKYILSEGHLQYSYLAVMIMIICITITMSYKIYNKKDITV